MWFSFIAPEEVSSVEEAVAILARDKADWAIGFGAHYGRDRMFDDPANLRLFAACAQVGLPVMFPNVNFIAHADWWRYLPEGTCDLACCRIIRPFTPMSPGWG